MSTTDLAGVRVWRPSEIGEAIGDDEFWRRYEIVATVVRTPFSPTGVVLVVEVESPSSITTDRVTKPWQYATAGIPHYWRVELDPLRLNVHRLAGGVYELIGTWGADETAVVTEPFDTTIDLAALR